MLRDRLILVVFNNPQCPYEARNQAPVIHARIITYIMSLPPDSALSRSSATSQPLHFHFRKRSDIQLSEYLIQCVTNIPPLPPPSPRDPRPDLPTRNPTPLHSHPRAAPRKSTRLLRPQAHDFLPADFKIHPSLSYFAHEWRDTITKALTTT